MKVVLPSSKTGIENVINAYHMSKVSYATDSIWTCVIIISLHIQSYTYCWILSHSTYLTEDVLCISASLMFMLVNAIDSPSFSYFPLTNCPAWTDSLSKRKWFYIYKAKETLNDLEVYMRYSQLQDDWEGCCWQIPFDGLEINLITCCYGL